MCCGMGLVHALDLLNSNHSAGSSSLLAYSTLYSPDLQLAYSWPTALYSPDLPSLGAVRHRGLALPLPPARVDPREGGHGHDHPPHPRRHVRGRPAEHPQGQLRVRPRHLDVHLHHLCLLHPAGVRGGALVSIQTSLK